MPQRKNFYRSDPSNHGDEIAEVANDALRSRPARRRARGAPSWDAAPRPRTLPRAAAAASSVRKQIVVDMGAWRLPSKDGLLGQRSLDDDAWPAVIAPPGENTETGTELPILAPVHKTSSPYLPSGEHPSDKLPKTSAS